jgi:hypothetical protein
MARRSRVGSRLIMRGVVGKCSRIVGAGPFARSLRGFTQPVVCAGRGTFVERSQARISRRFPTPKETAPCSRTSPSVAATLAVATAAAPSPRPLRRRRRHAARRPAPGQPGKAHRPGHRLGRAQPARTRRNREAASAINRAEDKAKADGTVTKPSAAACTRCRTTPASASATRSTTRRPPSREPRPAGLSGSVARLRARACAAASALYSALRGAPLIRPPAPPPASAAVRRSSTRARALHMAIGQRVVGRAGSACSTSTNSPRSRFASAASQAGRDSAGSVCTVSNCLVSSRHR